MQIGPKKFLKQQLDINGKLKIFEILAIPNETKKEVFSNKPTSAKISCFKLQLVCIPLQKEFLKVS